MATEACEHQFGMKGYCAFCKVTKEELEAKEATHNHELILGFTMDADDEIAASLTLIRTRKGEVIYLPSEDLHPVDAAGLIALYSKDC